MLPLHEEILNYIKSVTTYHRFFYWRYDNFGKNSNCVYISNTPFTDIKSCHVSYIRVSTRAQRKNGSITKQAQLLNVENSDLIIVEVSSGKAKGRRRIHEAWINWDAFIL